MPAEHSVCECVRRLVSSVSALAKGQRVRACVRACCLSCPACQRPGLSLGLTDTDANLVAHRLLTRQRRIGCSR